jgi:hypothetical protein
MGFPFLAVAAGIGVAEGIAGAGQKRDQARTMAESVQKQIDLLGKQKSELVDLYRVKQGYMTDAYGNRVSTLLDRVGSSLADLNYDYEGAVGKTNMSFSGSVESRFADRRSQISRGARFGQESEALGLRESLLDLTMAKHREVGGIDTQITGLEGEKKLYEEQGKQRFLGIF